MSNQQHSAAAIACNKCGHIGGAVQLTSDRPDRKICTPIYTCGACGHVFSPEPALLSVSSEIRACFEEDGRRGERKGGGSSAKRAPKPGDALLHGNRGAKELPPIEPDKKPVTVRVEAKIVVRTFRVTPTEDAAIWSVCNSRGLTLPQAFEEAMGQWVDRYLDKQA